ncbi:hypothetical protein ACFFRR_007213 [Megaselia abdita]
MLRTTLFEEKLFLGKILVCEFNVSNIKFKISGHQTTTNKWLQTFEWEMIYEKLDDILKKTKEVNLMDMDMSSFRIDNYIEVYLKKAAVQPILKPFATLLGRKDIEFTPVYLKIYIKRLSSCKEELPEIREIEIDITPSPSSSSSHQLEYDPTVNGSNGNTLAYTPSNISNSEEAYTPSKMKGESNASYVPKPISPPKRDYISSPEISAGTLPPQYKASKIRSRSQSPKTPSKKKKVQPKEETKNDRPKRTGSARKDQPKRTARSDDEGENSKASKKKRENVTVRNPQPPVGDIQSTKLDDGWKSSRSVDKERRNRDRDREPSSCSSSSSSSSKNKSSKERHRDKNSEGSSSSKKDIRHFMSPIAEKSKKVDKEDLKVSEVPFPLSNAEKLENERKKIKEMERFNAIFNEINFQAEKEKKSRPKPPRDEFLSLKYRNIDDLLGTFIQYKEILDPIIKDYIQSPFTKIKGVEGLMQYKTDGLVPEPFLLKIMEFLNDKYELVGGKVNVSHFKILKERFRNY